MIKLETHCHCLGGSGCAHSSVDILLDEYKKAGYGGIVLTNHIHPAFYYGYYPDGDKRAKLDYFFGLYDDFCVKAKEKGIKPFLGAEIYVKTPPNTFAEYLIYGFDRKLLYDSPVLLEFSQEELFRWAEKNGVFVCQAHPFRRSVKLGDPKFMHGVESFNGHVGHESRNYLAEKFCKENNLIATSGTDYHDPQQPITGGIYMPDDVDTDEQLVKYLFKGEHALIKEQELYERKFRGIREEKWV